MPSPEQYASAIKTHEILVGFAKAIDPEGESRAVADTTIALRWLRVGAAMEAGTLNVSLGYDGRWDAAYNNGTGYDNAFSAPDPLTAAERAMGVGT